MSKVFSKMDYNGFVASLKERLNNKIGKGNYRLEQLIIHHKGLHLTKINCKLTVIPRLKNKLQLVTESVQVTGLLYDVTVGCLIACKKLNNCSIQYKIKDDNKE